MGHRFPSFSPFFLPLPLPLSYLPYVAIFLSLTFSFLFVSLHFPLPAFSFPTPRSLISHFPLSHFPLPTPTSRAHLSHRRRASSGTPDTIISSSSPEFGVNNQASNQPSPGAKMKRVISDKRTPTAPYPTSAVNKSYLPVGFFT